ncbi:ligase-associated DNA damage response endonuclease PdeM [Aridibaculum aurantiacum]|uniref:ligase-associated DNA damage response endonuclease PdeM n=1 Tax=Aridibaculum aurantiacum TaxID=2810307 RepID=UPI001A958219
MQAAKKFLLHEQTLWLSPERCIFWEEQSTLIVSDLHFGKTGHFRKAGIGVPQNVYKEDLQRLLAQVQHYRPHQLVVVGDLFHSNANKEMDLFMRWRHDFSQLHIALVKGNHDILSKGWYSQANIAVSDDHLAVDSFCFVHDIAAKCDAGKEIKYYFSGHIHPCITLRGVGKQSLKFPCYFFGASYAVLPAFGKFTGTAHIEPKATDRVFAILPSDKVRGEKAAVVDVMPNHVV